MSPYRGSPPFHDDLTQLALDKLQRVLGEAQGRRVFAETLGLARLTELRTPNDLHAFGEQLTRRGGMEAAVGSLLTVAAIVRGANPVRGK